MQNNVQDLFNIKFFYNMHYISGDRASSPGP
jgi:hypothetical protein